MAVFCLLHYSIICLVICLCATIAGSMPNLDSITPKVAAPLLAGALHESCNVQVTEVLEDCSPSGGKKHNINISNGLDQLDCFVSPQLFYMLESKALDQYTIVSIHCASVSETCWHAMVVLVNMVPVSEHKSVIGDPQYNL